LTVGLIFLAIAVLHLLRIILGWGAVIGGWVVPEWVSWAALIIAGFLAFHGLRLSRADQA
jgi:hypothetical protein